ncbi:hypothetical protein K470DRAFT_256054 [Piedraia hortae CBS 480.64]|uniref:Uncharacterized protein n=1 Tax=Piedraia hortae CBS 480.64 TaxID=1314780 RepID=A0A6A7C5U6_9PEZI|nr:hypothetical protein K470DRAFT_256054 [Piedraia hortae CBS 480.64]
MDLLARLLPQRPLPSPSPADPRVRLERFKRYYRQVRARNRLKTHLDRLIVILRHDIRALLPHLCVQFAAHHRIYEIVECAAASFDVGLLGSSVTLFAILADCDEEGFLGNENFSSSLIRLSRLAVERAEPTITAIVYELLFIITAKIRLQPEILPVWFRSLSEEKSSQRDEFPLAYLLVDRVHCEGRIGDFSRTGLLYIFEATASDELAKWMVTSDLPPLMASGLGALYSQLGRELCILHPDATLPAILALSDYDNAQDDNSQEPVAESYFSAQHRAHMATFFSYLAFWQDVLDRCRSQPVRVCLVDNFQALFVRQLLYPSLLQSSDTDAGSSVAVLTYLRAMFECLDYPDVICMTLTYLLNLPSADQNRALARPDAEIMEPSLFNLADLMLQSIMSEKDQTTYAALRLLSTMIAKQRSSVWGTLIQVQRPTGPSGRTCGALEVETQRYMQLAQVLPRSEGWGVGFASILEDVHDVINQTDHEANVYSFLPEDSVMRTLYGQLRTFLTNGVDVNLALTQAVVTLATSVELRLDGWLAMSPSGYEVPEDTNAGSAAASTWRTHVHPDEEAAFRALEPSWRQPVWEPPPLYRVLESLTKEVETISTQVPNLHHLLIGRESMLFGNHSIPSLVTPDTAPTTDMLMREVEVTYKKASLNHVLTNIIVLREFIYELVAVLQVRAAVLGEQECLVST